jgi:hypothetical protein
LLIYRNVKQGIGRIINVSVLSSRLSESGNQWIGIDPVLSKGMYVALIEVGPIIPAISNSLNCWWSMNVVP